MTKLEIIESPKNYYTLQGKLNRNSIPKSAALAKFEQDIQGNSSVNVATLDMSDVTDSDTAGLAWLMNLLKSTRQQDIHFELKHIPESLIKLAKISDVDGFLSVQ